MTATTFEAHSSSCQLFRMGGMPPPAAGREYYIDRLRVVMTVIVIVAHTGMTYGGAGYWTYRELPVSSSPSSLLLSAFTATNETYVMGLFFLLAGYFTPASYDRKGPAQFLWDRCLRLGIPLLVFGLVIAPFTVAMVSLAEGHGFWPAIEYLWRKKEFINGPLWFAQALLIFSLGYMAWRFVATRFFRSTPLPDRIPKSMPGSFAWFWSAIGVGLASLAIRQPLPVDTRFFGLWLGYFASFIFLFAVGVAAWRNDWLSRVSWKQAISWLIVAFFTWFTLPLTKLYLKHRGINAYFAGGHSFAAIVYAFWEPFIAWGLIATWLVWLRTSFNRPSQVQNWLSRRAYAVYVLHAPVLIALSLMLRHWHAPSLVKVLVVSILCCTITWLICDPLVRLPGIRRIV